MHTQINKMLNVLTSACASPSWYVPQVLHYGIFYITLYMITSYMFILACLLSTSLTKQ